MIETRFKETEVGRIPEDWEVKKMGQLFDIQAAGDLLVRCFSENPNKNHPYPIFSNSVINKGLYGYTSKPRYKAGSFTITGRGTLGVAEYRDVDYDAIIRLLILSPKENVSSAFFSKYTNYFHPFQGSATSIPQLPIPNVANEFVAIPSIEEQIKIADALTSVDELISGIRVLIAKKRSIKEGTMSELLTGRKRLPGFDEPWTECILSDISTYGQEMLPADIFEDTTYVCTENMTSNFGGVEPYLDVCDFSYVKNYVPGDILLSNIRPYLKKLWLSTTSGGCSADVLIIRPDYNKVNPAFLYQVLSDDSFFNYIITGVSGTKMPRGNKYQIMNFQLCIPVLEEQQVIANILTSMDSEIEALENKLHKYEQIKQGMMQQLLTGKIRLI